jgi:hypothetical protein
VPGDGDRIERHNRASIIRSHVTHRRPVAWAVHDPAGLRLSVFGISRDAKYYVHTYARLLSDLYVVDGLK